MFEAKLSEGVIFKKIVESIKDIVTDVNIDVGPTGKFTTFYIVFFLKTQWLILPLIGISL